ncbi:MAG: hypothetical protein ACE5GO_01285 [Anaerolineales bacterium]
MHLAHPSPPKDSPCPTLPTLPTTPSRNCVAPPSSQMRPELVWEGKYDEYGSRREKDVAGLAMPLQRIETVDEPRSRPLVQGRLFESARSHRDDFRNWRAAQNMRC